MMTVIQEPPELKGTYYNTLYALGKDKTRFMYIQKLATYLRRRRTIHKSLRPGTVGYTLHTAS